MLELELTTPSAWRPKTQPVIYDLNPSPPETAAGASDATRFVAANAHLSKHRRARSTTAGSYSAYTWIRIEHWPAAQHLTANRRRRRDFTGQWLPAQHQNVNRRWRSRCLIAPAFLAQSCTAADWTWRRGRSQTLNPYLKSHNPKP